MPHILTRKHKDIEITNNVIDGVKFNYIAHSTYEDKICVSCEGKNFFLTKLTKEDNHLIKIDSSTRVTPIKIVKQALNAYAKICGAEVLFSNASNDNNRLEPKKEYLKEITYFVDEFSTTKDICVEVGFGSGRHMLYQAEQNPDTIYIGLEIHTPSIEQMLKQVKIKDIKNVYAVNYDARLFLEFLQSNSVSQVFVHFPVPWDKKPHRRVMSDEFIEECMRVLKVDGSLELRTDSPNYFEYNEELLTHFPSYKSIIVKNQDLAISSKYEDRWKKQGKDIWDVTIYSKDESSDIIINKDFSFDIKNNISQENLENNLPQKPVVKDGYFVHMEHLYVINNNKFLLHLTMGSFNKPLAKYVVIENSQANYFQSNPIPTSANQDAHKLINELLNKAIV
ncbi:MAG TPA: tRNA (guanosine(46)-N7)-methyltransferase TrmB [Arcobacter sp.]|nr:tRNA (guanosine(46)-N7)-methyltransferase TrmB [Arcobacter sp.]HIP55845.1 tRNA (guanosine(46)-N7)-methyltransferase TrmB [Arcobacter sp.]